MVQVLEYLNKKGYTRTEQILRQESSNVDKDGRPIIAKPEDNGTGKYKQAFELVSGWIDTNLDIYKVGVFSASARNQNSLSLSLN